MQATIKQILQDIFKDKSVKQKEVAEKLGLDISVVNRWARGKTLPNCYNLEQLIIEGYIPQNKLFSLYPKNKKKSLRKR